MDYKDREDFVPFSGEKKGKKDIPLIFDRAVNINRNTTKKISSLILMGWNGRRRKGPGIED